jgi:nicotinate-nucleotide pyrophosphorylase (carboxylating)
MYRGNIKADVIRALQEDIGSGDVTAELLPEALNVTAQIISREAMIVCGIAWINAVFSEINSQIEINWFVNDGMWLDKPTQLCLIHGPVRDILTAERTALNFLQTLSGTATQTYLYMQKIDGSKTKLLDTRKTIPGLRDPQKYAVKCGGGENHRFGLYDAYLIKENHIKACGSISNAVNLAKNKHPHLFLEVEVESLQEFQEALSLPIDRIMLDNFNLHMLKEAIELRGNLPVQLEFSGNVNLENISLIASEGVDYISVGALTKSVKAIDLSLLIME